jgi:hypothetical protein
MKIYLASSWRNEHHPSVLAGLRAAGHEVYDFRDPDTGFTWKQVIDRPINDAWALLKALEHPVAQQGFDADFGAMQWADACVLLLPCGNSAHMEAGWFAGAGAPVVVLIPELREPELMYKLFDMKIDGTTFTPICADLQSVLHHLMLLEGAGDI